MAARKGDVDPWSPIHEAENIEGDAMRIGVVYRRKPHKQTGKDVQMPEDVARRRTRGGRRASLMHRSLSTRGRTSITVSENENYKAQLRRQDPKRKPKQTVADKKNILLLEDFVTEQVSFFQEVDSFDLVEESPSPKIIGRWIQEPGEKQMDLQDIKLALHPTLRKWLRSRPINYGSASLTDILETQSAPKHGPGDAKASEISDSSSDNSLLHLRNNSTSLEYDTMEEKVTPLADTIIRSSNIVAQSNDDGNVKQAREVIKGRESDKDGKELEEAIKRLSISHSTSSFCEHVNAFTKLLKLCGQSSPSTLSEAFSEFCDITNISKIGEGTYGEAFKGSGYVFKIVPIDGDFLVNGEIQKRCSELLEEVLLSLALNSLRGHVRDDGKKNTCKSFIETKGIRVCQGVYEEFLINAWEDWDVKHTSENDHPESFSKQQFYVVFILEDGGTDLESFVLKNFNEARSLLIQVTAALAVAEVACEFEHRDLHWGNILLSRTSDETEEFIFQGKKLHTRTFGLSISIIDFTLSRMNNGNAILFMDLSGDPALFEGPKGDRQSETYRKMLEVTHGCWEESFPKTNVLWLKYLVDILLSKKTFGQTTKDERELRSLKKRLLSCCSAQDALMDTFFEPLWIEGYSPATPK